MGTFDCAAHGHTHPQLPCAWPPCSPMSGPIVEILKHNLAHVEWPTDRSSFTPSFRQRRFTRRIWGHDKCGQRGYAWVEDGAPLPSIGVCPVHDVVGTVIEKPHSVSGAMVLTRNGLEKDLMTKKGDDPMMADLLVGLCALADVLRSATAPMSRTDVERAVARILLSRRENLREIPWDDVIRRAIIEHVLTVAADMWGAGPDIGDVPALKDGSG